jgi:hypothetical protein
LRRTFGWLRRQIENCIAAPWERFAAESHQVGFPLSVSMIWIVWALLLIAHGAVSRWAKTSQSYAQVSVVGDLLLIAVALITMDQLQGLGLEDVVRVGLFFTAFGWAGRQLMGSLLKTSARA